MDIKNLSQGSYIVHNSRPFVVKEIELLISNKTANVVLEDLFTGEMIEKAFSLSNQIQEAEISRKCASIISKSDDRLEIIDSVSFETINAVVSEKLLEKVNENDQVTYIKFGNSAKVIEINKI